MADFAAVIRRAVDGLAENTPEMRVKVYEKARGAVQRQLESMKPRPPEDMLRRQMDKLELAIVEVENEHAEALPPVEDEAEEEFDYQDDEADWDEASAEAKDAPADDDPTEAIAEEAAAEEDEAVAEVSGEVVAEEPASVSEPQPEEPWQEREDEDAAPTDVTEAPWQADEAEEPANEDDRPAVSQEPWDELVEPPEERADEQSSTGIVPDDRQIGMWQEPLPEETPEEAAETVYADTPEPVAEAEREPWEIAHEAARDQSVPVADDAWDEPEPPPPAEPHFVEEQGEPEPELQSVSEDAHRRDPLFDDLGDYEAPAHAASDAGTVSAHFEPETLTATPSLDRPAELPQEQVAPSPEWDVAPVEPVSAEAAQEPPAIKDEALQPPPMPPALDLLDWDESMFDPAPAVKSTAAGKVEPAGDNSAAPPKDEGKDSFDDFFADVDKPATGEPENKNDVPPADAGVAPAAPAAPISYRAEPKRRFNVRKLVVSLVLLAVVGGAGYAGWLYRDKIAELTSGFMANGPAGSETVPATAENPDKGAARSGGSAATNGGGDQLASTDGAQPSVNKFTQRLLADGSEEDSGPAPGAEQPAAGEGKSVAEQNVASNEAPNASAGGQQAGQAQPQAPAQDASAATGQGDKMFLYEERIGQSVPTAIAGNVVWSLQQETDDNGKPEPTVQAQINVPERGLSALMTFKRNTDPSLPASHLVEIVFSLPPNFEGGAIESVQRIAMKTSEQDRGNALIAVPAKITDDFHMIALNDFPEARATNLELLRTRSWIDMPVTYRNGRRALLTLEKGPDGTEAFNKAIQAWNALGSTSSN